MEKISLAVVGGVRGAAFREALPVLGDEVELRAICDPREAIRARWREEHPGIESFADFDQLLERSGCDAVFIATPLLLHAEQAIKAMRAGMHVLSDVTAAATLEECWALVETAEATGRTYMMGENYVYWRENMAVLHMVKQGRFGEVYYAEGGYIHDCSSLLLSEEGRLVWRGELRRDKVGNWYPTHALGAPAWWLGAVGPEGDRLTSLSAFAATGNSVERFLARNLPEGHPALQMRFQMRDCCITVIRTARGKLLVLRVDWASRRPHNTLHYVLQGTAGAYVSARHPEEEGLVWLDGASPATAEGTAIRWEPFSRYAQRYDHPLWQQWGERAQATGHGGMDFFVLLEFVSAIREKRPPRFDVYDAAAWSAISPLSDRSIAANGAPVEIPDFRRR